MYRTIVAKYFVKHSQKDIPFCINCTHFIPDYTNYPFDGLADDSNNGRCKKFSKIDMVTGTKIYDFAIRTRSDNSKCGVNGLEFSPRIKNPNHTL